MHQRLVLVVERPEKATSWIEKWTAYQLEPLAAQSSPIDAQLSLEGDLEVAAPVRHRKAFGGLHAGLKQAVAMHFKGKLFVIVVGVEFADLE